MRVQVVACPLYGGIRLPWAIGAVVVPLAGRQTPLSGQLSPVRAVVPIGLRMALLSMARQCRRAVMINQYEFVCQDQSVRSCMMSSMAEMSFGARLRTFRMRSKLSLQQLADAVGASKAHIWDLEQGKTKNPSLQLLTELSRALDVSIKDLVGEGDETASSDPPQLAPLFRELRGLTPEQLDLIKTMTEKLKGMGDGNKSDGGSQ
jgi:transcriptional regulator with XRE-family HTH domain